MADMLDVMNEKKSQDEKEAAQSAQQYYVIAPTPVDEDIISLVDLFCVLKKNKWLISFVMFVFTLCAVLYVLFATPKYRAEAILAPVEKSGGGGALQAIAGQYSGLVDLAGISLPGDSNMETVIATLKSRRFIAGFIRDNNLKPILFEDRWDGKKHSWIAVDPSVLTSIKRAIIPEQKSMPVGKELLKGEPSDWEAYKLFREDILSVERDVKTGLVTVRAEWEDPVMTAEWVNSLVTRLNSELRRQAIEENERATEYLKKQIQVTSLAELREMLFRLIEAHTKNITLAKVKSQYALSVIDPAVVPEEKVSPKRTFIVLLGLVLGLVLGVFTAVLRNVFIVGEEKD